MSSHNSNDVSSDGVQEKAIVPHGYGGYPAVATGQQQQQQPLLFQASNLPYGLTDGLANLKVLFCPGCSSRWEPPEG